MACSIKLTDKIIVLKDSGNGKCRMIFNNPKQHVVTRHRVDSCLITEGCRCDFKMDCPNYENYIEIKGKDILYACRQIEETIKVLSRDARLFPKKSFVIATSVPTMFGSLQLIMKKFKKSYNSSLVVSSKCHKEEIQ